MIRNFICPIEGTVERLFSEVNARGGDGCENPVTGRGFIRGCDTIPTQKQLAIAALSEKGRRGAS